MHKKNVGVPHIEEKAKKKEAAQEKREGHLEKRRQPRELCVEKKIERREQSVAAFERDN